MYFSIEGWKWGLTYLSGEYMRNIYTTCEFHGERVYNYNSDDTNRGNEDERDYDDSEINI